jgi:hypothetical protein
MNSVGKGTSAMAAVVRIALGVGALLIMGVTRQAYSDDTFKVVHIQCSPEKNLVQITPFYVYNPTTDGDAQWITVTQGKLLRHGNSTYYPGQSQIHSTCKLRDRTVTIHIRYNMPSATGQCGGNPAGFLNVTENGKPIIEGEVVHDCMKIHQTAFLLDKKDGWQQCTVSGKVANLYEDPERSCSPLPTLR